MHRNSQFSSVQAVSHACVSESLLEEASTKAIELKSEISKAFAIIQTATSKVDPVVLKLGNIDAYDKELEKDAADQNFDSMKVSEKNMVESREVERIKWFADRKKHQFDTIDAILIKLRSEIPVKCTSRAKENTVSYLQAQLVQMKQQTTQFIGQLMISQLSICPGCMTPPYMPAPSSSVGNYIKSIPSSNAYKNLCLEIMTSHQMSDMNTIQTKSFLWTRLNYEAYFPVVDDQDQQNFLLNILNEDQKTATGIVEAAYKNFFAKTPSKWRRIYKPFVELRNAYEEWKRILNSTAQNLLGDIKAVCDQSNIQTHF